MVLGKQEQIEKFKEKEQKRTKNVLEPKNTMIKLKNSIGSFKADLNK